MTSVNNPRVSILIRGKDEEDWLGLCLRSLREQTFKDFEVIYIDNESKDASLKIAKYYKVDKVLSIKKYLPGLAINKGFKNSRAEFIVILSAHCIPSSKNWLQELVDEIQDQEMFSGIYGRQLPLKCSSPDDSRDLMITFPDEDRIQISDPFFHNAHSIISKKVWKKYPFNNDISNIEDREWAARTQKAGYKIKYASRPKVYHFHGIHQHGKNKSFRSNDVNNLIKSMDSFDDYNLPNWLKTKERICPIVFYGDVSNIPSRIKKYLRTNKINPMDESLFFYGEKNPKIKNISFLNRTISKHSSFLSFTRNILDLANKSFGYSIEAICFVDLSYKKFIKDSYISNKIRVFEDNIPFSCFAYEDLGDIWLEKENDVKPLKEIFDENAKFLRVTFGQSSVIRASSIRKKDFSLGSGFAHKFNDIDFLIREKS